MNPDSSKNVQSSCDEEQMDDETQNWKVDPSFQDAVDAIKPSYIVAPLRAYQGKTGDEFIEPTKTTETIRKVLLQVHFSVHHTFLGNQKPPHDTFRANIEQIIVLRKGAMSTSAYHSNDPRLGPVKLTHPSPVLTLPPQKKKKGEIGRSIHCQ
ncbi:hypothetical protein BDN67DRAFT_976212 [Paxillus ammoniavirescens]|nr:hypothetical protein BDN67DRAFT_976212 [Paxillus ammoniavirescens]